MNGMAVEEMRARRVNLATAIEKLQAEHRSLDRAIRDAESREWITLNSIAPTRVQLSTGEGVPWHGTVHGFAEWIRSQGARKPYAEWNGRIYLTTDLLNGRMVETPGLIEHVQEVTA